MKLPNAPEPTGIKEEAKFYHQKYPDMASDSLYIWTGRSLASYLWSQCGWGKVLRKERVSWQEFEKIVHLVNPKSWVRGEKDWNKMLEGFTEVISKWRDLRRI